MPSCREFLPSGNPRIRSCARCGRRREAHPPDTRPRDLRLERELSALAARAAGLAGTGGLDDFADQRAWPGGVRLDLDVDQEASEELADCRNYLLWGLVPLYERVQAGDPAVLDEYERRMRALACVIQAFVELHRGSA